MKHMKLSELCHVTAGLVLSRRESEKTEKNKVGYRVITLKSFESDGWINEEHCDELASSSVLEDKYIAKKGDVLVRLSSPYTAIAVTKSHEGYVVSSLFAILRIRDERVLPGYLSYVLNSPVIKHRYHQTSMGSTIPVIRMQTLKDTEVLVPPLEKQEKIARLSELMIKEKRLYQELIETKNFYYKELSKKLLGGFKNAK